MGIVHESLLRPGMEVKLISSAAYIVVWRPMNEGSEVIHKFV